MEFGTILYSKAAQSGLARLDSSQTRIESMCRVTFQPLTTYHYGDNALTLGLMCCLLAGEG